MSEPAGQSRPTDVLWMHRLFNWGAPRCPHFVEPVIRVGWVVLFFALAGAHRRAVTANLRALFPDWGRARALFGTWWVFWSFAGSLVDASRLRRGEEFCWEVHGGDYFRCLEREPGGLLLATAHMGSYDAAAGAFVGRFSRPLALVRQGEPDPRIDELRAEQVRRDTKGRVRIYYNRGVESQLGLDLLRALRGGDVIAIQADRALPGLASVKVEAEGLELQMPAGPWELAAVANAPIYPLFCWKAGPDHYRIRFTEPLKFELREGEGRREAVARTQRDWAGVLLGQLRCAWPQWYVFEPSLESGAAADPVVEDKGTVWQPDSSRAEFDGAGEGWRCFWWEATATALWIACLWVSAGLTLGWFGWLTGPLLVWFGSLMLAIGWGLLAGLVAHHDAEVGVARLVRERLVLGVLMLASAGSLPILTASWLVDAARGPALWLGTGTMIWALLGAGPWMLCRLGPRLPAVARMQEESI